MSASSRAHPLLMLSLGRRQLYRARLFFLNADIYPFTSLFANRFCRYETTFFDFYIGGFGGGADGL